MVFDNDSLHGLKDPKDKTKTQRVRGKLFSDFTNTKESGIN
jgi:hypothetical protein